MQSTQTDTEHPFDEHTEQLTSPEWSLGVPSWLQSMNNARLVRTTISPNHTQWLHTYNTKSKQRWLETWTNHTGNKIAPLQDAHQAPTEVLVGIMPTRCPSMGSPVGSWSPTHPRLWWEVHKSIFPRIKAQLGFWYSDYVELDLSVAT